MEKSSEEQIKIRRASNEDVSFIAACVVQLAIETEGEILDLD